MKKLATSVFAIAMITAGVASADIKISGKNEQSVVATNNLIVTNAAIGSGVKAKQNLASNQGNVEIGSSNMQEVRGKNVIVTNAAIGVNAIAIQNLSSNSSATE